MTTPKEPSPRAVEESRRILRVNGYVEDCLMLNVLAQALESYAAEVTWERDREIAMKDAAIETSGAFGQQRDQARAEAAAMRGAVAEFRDDLMQWIPKHHDERCNYLEPPVYVDGGSIPLPCNCMVTGSGRWFSRLNAALAPDSGKALLEELQNAKDYGRARDRERDVLLSSLAKAQAVVEAAKELVEVDFIQTNENPHLLLDARVTLRAALAAHDRAKG